MSPFNGMATSKFQISMRMLLIVAAATPPLIAMSSGALGETVAAYTWFFIGTILWGAGLIGGCVLWVALLDRMFRGLPKEVNIKMLFSVAGGILLVPLLGYISWDNLLVVLVVVGPILVLPTCLGTRFTLKTMLILASVIPPLVAVALGGFGEAALTAFWTSYVVVSVSLWSIAIFLVVALAASDAIAFLHRRK